MNSQGQDFEDLHISHATRSLNLLRNSNHTRDGEIVRIHAHVRISILKLASLKIVS
jgi:hypothetical protein